MLRDNPTVTFCADFYTLNTVAPINVEVDTEVSDYAVINCAALYLQELYGFNPADFAFEITVDWDR